MSINLSSYWLNLFTPVPFGVAKALIEGLKSEVTIQNDNAVKYFPTIKPILYEISCKKWTKEIEETVISRWNDTGSEFGKKYSNEITSFIY